MSATEPQKQGEHVSHRRLLLTVSGVLYVLAIASSATGIGLVDGLGRALIFVGLGLSIPTVLTMLGVMATSALDAQADLRKLKEKQR